MESILIGHRGEPETWPENSYEGFEAVLQAGALYIETDVQITSDGVAVLSHDPSLLKITGLDQAVTETTYKEISALSAGYPDRFGNKYSHFSITRLDKFAELLKQWPKARAFVEIKHASITAFGVDKVVDTVLAALDEVLDQVIIISFDYESLVYTCKVSDLPIGWVLPAWSEEHRLRAYELSPDYLFCNRKRLPPEPDALWDGSWSWAVYTVNDASELAAFIERGIRMVETNVITRLLRANGSGSDAGG